MTYNVKVTRTCNTLPEKADIGDIVVCNGEIYAYIDNELGFERISSTVDESTPREVISRKFIRDIKCKYCGAPIDIHSDDRMNGFALCSYCGSFVNIYDD